jgi:hypothetical protein
MPPAVFAITPAHAIRGLLDYSKAEHHKVYKSGIRPVSEDPFNCDADGLFQFLREVEDRADEMGWSAGILNVAVNAEGEEERRENFVQNYGTITLEQVVTSELQHINGGERKTQDTYMLYRCLMASLTSEAKKKIMIWQEQYHIGQPKASSGVALLKVIIRESHLDTNATTNQIRTKLSSLDTYIMTVDSDIGKFNQYVKLLIQSLTARNQSTSDLLINLFKGYGAVSDEVFRAWLMRKQDDHEEGEEITPDELMIAAKNKYDTMVEKGTWNAPTAEEKIVALEAKFKSTMKTLNKKVSFDGSSKKKGAKPGADKSGSKKKGQKNEDHPKKWKAPKSNDKKEVEFKGHTWYWCGKETGGKCEKWRAHKPSECKGLSSDAGAKDKRKRDSKGSDKGNSFAKKLKVARAYVAKLEQQSADKSDSSSDDNEENDE